MDIELIIIVIGFTIAFLLEAKHDYIISEKEALIRSLLKGDAKGIEEQEKLKQQWHKIDWFYLFFISIVISFTFNGNYIEKFLILVIISMLKIIVFNTYLNKLLGNDLCYLGSGYIERLFKGKEMFYYIAAAVFLISSIVAIWIM